MANTSLSTIIYRIRSEKTSLERTRWPPAMRVPSQAAYLLGNAETATSGLQNSMRNFVNRASQIVDRVLADGNSPSVDSSNMFLSLRPMARDVDATVDRANAQISRAQADLTVLVGQVTTEKNRLEAERAALKQELPELEKQLREAKRNEAILHMLENLDITGLAEALDNLFVTPRLRKAIEQLHRKIHHVEEQRKRIDSILSVLPRLTRVLTDGVDTTQSLRNAVSFIDSDLSHVQNSSPHDVSAGPIFQIHAIACKKQLEILRAESA